MWRTAVLSADDADLESSRRFSGVTGGDMIRKALLILGTAGVALTVSASAGATHSLLDYESAVDALLAVDPTIEPASNDDGKDFAVGGFQHSFRDNKVGFSGHSGPIGESPWGRLSETIPTPGGLQQGRFRVTCVAVMGQSAALGLVPEDTGSNDQPDSFVLALFDGGPGGTLDTFTFYFDNPALCEVRLGQAFFPIESGNILIHDALVSP
jgi:hypothetical protein